MAENRDGMRCVDAAVNDASVSTLLGEFIIELCHCDELSATNEYIFCTFRFWYMK